MNITETPLHHRNLTNLSESSAFAVCAARPLACTALIGTMSLYASTSLLVENSCAQCMESDNHPSRLSSHQQIIIVISPDSISSFGSRFLNVVCCFRAFAGIAVTLQPW